MKFIFNHFTLRTKIVTCLLLIEYFIFFYVRDRIFIILTAAASCFGYRKKNTKIFGLLFLAFAVIVTFLVQRKNNENNFFNFIGLKKECDESKTINMKDNESKTHNIENLLINDHFYIAAIKLKEKRFIDEDIINATYFLSNAFNLHTKYIGNNFFAMTLVNGNYKYINYNNNKVVQIKMSKAGKDDISTVLKNFHKIKHSSEFVKLAGNGDAINFENCVFFAFYCRKETEKYKKVSRMNTAEMQIKSLIEKFMYNPIFANNETEIIVYIPMKHAYQKFEIKYSIETKIGNWM